MRAEVLSERSRMFSSNRRKIEGMPTGLARPNCGRIVSFRTTRCLWTPDPNQDPPCERLPDATMGQALHLMNAPRIHQRMIRAGGSAIACGIKTDSTRNHRRALLGDLQSLPEWTSWLHCRRVCQARYRTTTMDRIPDVSLINSPEFLYRLTTNDRRNYIQLGLAWIGREFP